MKLERPRDFWITAFRIGPILGWITDKAFSSLESAAEEIARKLTMGPTKIKWRILHVREIKP